MCCDFLSLGLVFNKHFKAQQELCLLPISFIHCFSAGSLGWCQTGARLGSSFGFRHPRVSPGTGVFSSQSLGKVLIHSRSELENDSLRKHAPKPQRWPPQCFPHCNKIMNCVAPCFSWHPRVFWLGYQAGLALCNQSIMKPTVIFSSYLWKPRVLSGGTLVLVWLLFKFNCIFSLSLQLGSCQFQARWKTKTEPLHCRIMDEFRPVSSRNVSFQTAEPWQGKF